MPKIIIYYNMFIEESNILVNENRNQDLRIRFYKFGEKAIVNDLGY